MNRPRRLYGVMLSAFRSGDASTYHLDELSIRLHLYSFQSRISGFFLRSNAITTYDGASPYSAIALT